LVNKQHILPEEAPVPLTNIGDGYRVHAEIYDALAEMMADAKAAGLPLYIVSGYRPIERSRVLYNNKVQEYLNAGYSQQQAEAEAGMWIAPPGTSEHSTGLAVDLISADYYTKLPDLLPEFEEFEEAKWLKEHCAEYGFILRFPKGKEDITQVVFEPWHFRYVGKQAAAEIMAAGITLEEYLGVA
jgi:D-alanyl-D-alanine carboxypeptidase